MKRLLLLVMGLVVGGLLAEGMVRLAAAVSPKLGRQFHEADPYAILVEPVGEFGYRQRPHSTFRYGNGTFATSTAMGFRGPEVPLAKPAGTFRILLLGGSTTHGFGVPDSGTIDLYMRELLAKRYPDAKFDVVNLAFDGYDSYQDFERFRAEGVRMDPDVVIVNSGINDVRNARYANLTERDPRTLIWEADLRRLRREQREGPSLRSRVKHYSYLARLIPIVREGRLRLGQARAGRNSPPNMQAADRFEENVSRIDSLASQRGMTVLLSTPPSSLLTKYQPSDTSQISYWLTNAATTQQFRDELDRRLRLLASRLARRGRSVAYVPHSLTPELFLDDCHLTAAGNRQLASDFVTALEPFLRGRRATAAGAARQRS